MGIERIGAFAVKALQREKGGLKLAANLADDVANSLKRRKLPNGVVEVFDKDGTVLYHEMTSKSGRVLRFSKPEAVSMDNIMEKVAQRVATPNSNGLSAFELNRLRRINEHLSDNCVMNIGKYMKGKTVQSLVENFDIKKSNLISEFTKMGNLQLVARLQRAKTPEQVTKILFEEEFVGFRQLDKIVSKAGLKSSTLEFEQMAHSVKTARNRFIIARERAMYVPSKEPQVIAIENILREQYGVKFVSFKDDIKLAKETLKAFEIASKNGVKLPKNVIVSDFMFASGEHLDDTILLASKNSQLMSSKIQRVAVKDLPDTERMFLQNNITRLPNLSNFSTSSSAHVPLHEIMHGEHLPLIAFSTKKIPASFNQTKNCVSAYSALSGTHETFTELNTKRLIDGLNSQEQELYNYLNIMG